MNACDDVPLQELDPLTTGFMRIEAEALGIQIEQITLEFIAGMRKKMAHQPQNLSSIERDELHRQYAQEVLAELQDLNQPNCAQCAESIIR